MSDNSSAWDRVDAKYFPTAPRRLTGSAQFTTDNLNSATFTIEDFWSWAYSDLKTNASRGVLAEFLVAQAMGISTGVKSGWEPYDLELPTGCKVEVKTSGHLQSWATKELSEIKYSGLKAKLFNNVTDKYSETPTFNADVYVFCKQSATQHNDYDVLNLDQWQFYVAPVSYLKRKNQKTLSEKGLIKDGFNSVSFDQLRAEITRFEKEGELTSNTEEIPLWGATSSRGWNEEKIKNWLKSSESSFEVSNFQKLLDFAEAHAIQIIPGNGLQPGFSFRTSTPDDQGMLTIWILRTYGADSPVRLELSWTEIRDKITNIPNADQRVQQIINRKGGALRDVEVGGIWLALSDLSPLDIENFTQGILEVLAIINDKRNT